MSVGSCRCAVTIGGSRSDFVRRLEPDWKCPLHWMLSKGPRDLNELPIDEAMRRLEAVNAAK